MRGNIATYNIKEKKGKVLIEEGRRITARHIRQLEKAGIDQMEVPMEYLLGRALAKDVVDEKTGELLLECNTEITLEVLRSEEHTSELQSRGHLVCRLLLEKKNT